MYGLDKGNKYKQLIINKSHKQTDGLEFCKTDNEKIAVKNLYTEVYYCHCDYCNREILAVWDGYNSDNYWPYLGNMSKRRNTYKYSPIIEVLRKRYIEEGKDWKDNNLINSHTRVHSDKYDLRRRMADNSMRLLCNECFQKTYKRTLVDGDDGNQYAISVLEDREETIESVMKELGINGKIIGKGSIKDY